MQAYLANTGVAMRGRKVHSGGMQTTSDIHVVLGAGQIGSLLAQRLLALGHRVRQVRRGPAGAPAPGLEWWSGDLSDAAFAAEAMAGASVAYQCVCPPYHRWPQELPQLVRGTVEGAARSGAKLVVLDNLYAYGKPAGPIDEETRQNPCSKKGELRARLADEMLAAHRSGDARIVLGRASDFFGPGITLASIFGERYYRRVLAGKAGETFGDGSMPHTYSYGPDVAEGLRLLGTRDDVLGKVWLLPASVSESTAASLEHMARALGVRTSVSKVPTFVLRALGLFVPAMAEMVEMVYQWEVPYVVSDARFSRTFGVAATPAARAFHDTASWALARFSKRGVQSAAASAHP